MNQRQILTNLLRDCSKNSSFDKGSMAHGLVLRMGFESDLFLNNGLIDMYGKCGRTDLAHFVFDKMPDRNVVSWTALMCGYLQNGNANKCLSIFRRMGGSDSKPNEFTLSTSIKASAIVGVAKMGMQIHCLCAKAGFEFVEVVGNSLVDMYAKCRQFGDATRMFGAMPFRNLVTWNVMIAKYTDVGNGKRALSLFREMQDQGEAPDAFSLTSTLKACSVVCAFRQGRQVHGSVMKRGVSDQFQPAIVGALIDMYVKCGRLVEARRVFDQSNQKNAISWSALILGYAQEGNLEEAVNLFRRLRLSDRHQIDGYTISSLIGVFADFANVEQGKQLHALAIKISYCLDTSVANSILDLYFKCGMPDDAEKFFSRMVTKDVVSWTVMITGYGKHGLGRQAIEFFNKMQPNNLEPEDVSYLAVLTACSHSGLVDEGQEIFSRLLNNPQVQPRVHHYACVVDLLGRAGQLREAKNLIDNMPVKPSVGIWQTLLSACRVHGNLEMARQVGETLIQLDGNNNVNYVMLSNIFADAGHWKECEGLRHLAKMKGLKKEAGRSWVEIDKQVHFFYNRDDKHPLIGEIHQVLEQMERRMRAEIGYVPRVKFAMFDVEDETKAESLRAHSERLAIGLALVHGGVEERAATVRIFKNLRVCVDCHAFIKGLSKILKIVFLVRDANRFHKFKDGLCSCGEYW